MMQFRFGGLGAIPSMRQHQRGAALFVSLIILLVLSVIGISAMRGGLLQSLIAANTQQKEIANNVADAGVSATWAIATEQQRTDGGVLATASEASGAPVAFYVDSLGNLSAAPVKLDDDRDEPVLESRIEVVYAGPASQFCGPTSMVNKNLECTAFRVTGVGSVGGTSATVVGWLAMLDAGSPGAGEPSAP